MKKLKSRVLARRGFSLVNDHDVDDISTIDCIHEKHISSQGACESALLSILLDGTAPYE
jgi:hypothetical protein